MTDPGEGEPEARVGFRNPVIPGCHPDPSVCRFGDEYILACSSFAFFPGVPMFRSPDLVQWTQVGNALDRRSQLDLRETAGFPGLGIYAPTIRHHAGRLWLITTLTTARLTDSQQTFLVTAEDPCGPWSEPLWLDIPHIDPDLAWDDEGRCFVHTAGILRFQIDDTDGRVRAGPEVAWAPPNLSYPEAPHLLRRGELWYLLIAQGGTEHGHAVSIARSESPTGPWEPCPHNPILTHRSTDRPIQSTGHADMVEAPDGSWWMVLLGTRPRGRGFHVLGRETFVVPVEWQDGWPVPHELHIDMPVAPPGAGAPGLSSAHQDDFDTPVLGPQWVGIRRPPTEVSSLTERSGWLTLHGRRRGLDSPAPTFLGRRQQEHHCRARVLIERGDAEEAGLAIVIDERHHYEVAARAHELVVRARIGDVSSVVARRPSPGDPLILQIETHDDIGGVAGPAPDRIRLGVEGADGSCDVMADLDGRYLSTEVAAGFTGRLIGPYAVGGVVHVDWFRLENLDQRTAELR